MFSTDPFHKRSPGAPRSPASPPTRPEEAEVSDTERRLAAEIARAMEAIPQTPRRQSGGDITLAQKLDDANQGIATERVTTRDRAEAEARRPAPSQSVVAAAAAGVRPGDAAVSGDHQTYENTGRSVQAPGAVQWVKKARRERWRQRLRTVASWAITVLIGGTIVAAAAHVLFGARFDVAALWTLSKRALF